MGTAMYESMVGINHRNTKIRPDMAAFGYDKATGKPIWIDTNGRKYDQGDDRIRYDLNKDPHGWKATGKKVRQTDSRGRPNL